MSVLEVVKDGHPVLKKSAKRIRKMSDELRALADDLKETMVAANGVGLAANQVARPVRMISVCHGPDDIRVYVNPRITEFSDEIEYSDEGCLSFPLTYGTVARSVKVCVNAHDTDMKKVKLDAEGLLARIFQHEIDHLNGITFTERCEEGTLKTFTIEELQAERDRVESDEPDDESEPGEPSAAVDRTPELPLEIDEPQDAN
jgi:peptide deformylase